MTLSVPPPLVHHGSSGQLRKSTFRVGFITTVGGGAKNLDITTTAVCR